MNLIRGPQSQIQSMKLFVVALATLCLAFADEEKEKDDVGTVIGIDLGTTYSW